MKRLLLPLLAALALPTAVSAGDLGGADIPTIEEIYSPSSEIYQKKLRESRSNEFYFRCRRAEKYFLFKTVKCKVEFKNGRLIVDDSIGIKSSQVKSIIRQQFYNGWITVVSYIDSNDRYSIAEFFPLSGTGRMYAEQYPFIIRLLEWKSTGK
tara:strand:+ start:247 stop:705 length:459 start_codon:yes stop_codon:yes gene_type:complete